MNIIEQVVYSSQKRDEKTNRKSSLLSLHQYMGRTSITLLYDNRLNEEMDQVPNEVETMRRLIKMVKWLRGRSRKCNVWVYGSGISIRERSTVPFTTQCRLAACFLIILCSCSSLATFVHNLRIYLSNNAL